MGRSALMILLDQFPRNLFRGHRPHVCDRLASPVYYAGRALEKGHDLSFEPQLRAFFYLPFMHSENVDDQRRSVELCREGAPGESGICRPPL